MVRAAAVAVLMLSTLVVAALLMSASKTLLAYVAHNSTDVAYSLR